MLLVGSTRNPLWVFSVAVRNTRANTFGPLVQSLSSVSVLTTAQHAKQDNTQQRHSGSGLLMTQKPANQ